MKNKKTLLILSSLLSLGALASCSSCNCNQENKDESKKDEDVTPSKKEDPIYGDIKSYEGFIDTNIPLTLADGVKPYVLPLLTTNLTLEFQSATNVSEIDYYKSFKFHINLDLYSDETNFTTSLVTQKLLPSLFSDFKYTQIKDNVSDFDIYYLGDGMLYATLSTFKDSSKPSRNNPNAIKEASREIINVTRMDIKAIVNEIGDKIKNEDYKNFDFKGTIESISKVLNGISIDLELMNKIFTSSTLTFIENGFNYNLKENGVNNLSTFLNDTVIDLVNKSDLGISLEEGFKLIDLSSFEFEASTSSIKLNIESNDNVSPLINLSLYSKENNDTIEPSLNLEEEYLYNKSIINKVDELYLGYTNYEINDSYKETFQNLINNVTSLSKEDFKRISNFNSCNGYDLLEVNSDNTYGYLKDYNDILKSIENLRSATSLSLDNDKNILKGSETYFELMYGSNHYSDYLKENILSKVKESNESNYSNFILKIESFFNQKIDDLETSLNELKNKYLEIEEPSLNDTHSFIESLYPLLINNNVCINGSSNGIFDSDDMNESDKITSISYSLYKNYINSSIFSKKDKSDLSSNFKDIINSYLIQIEKSLKNVDKDLSLITTYSDLLMFNNNDDLEELFSLLDLISNTSFKSSIKQNYHNLISTLIKYGDKKANTGLDNVILENNIYKLNHKDKIEKKLEELESVYNYYYVYLLKNNKLLSKYISSMTFIDKYNTLKDLLNDELSYYAED